MSIVVILDDDKDFAEALYDTFCVLMDDVEFKVCNTSSQLYHIIDDTHVDLLLTDIVMPDESGNEIITKLKKSQPDLPIIAMSGFGKIDDTNPLTIAKNLGADATFSKPLSIIALSQEIETLLN